MVEAERAPEIVAKRLLAERLIERVKEKASK